MQTLLPAKHGEFELHPLCQGFLMIGWYGQPVYWVILFVRFHITFLMKNCSWFTILLILLARLVSAQVVTTSPVFPVSNQPLTITVDVSGTSLDKLAWDNATNPVYIWTWIKKAGSADIDAPTNVNPATSPGQDAAKCTRVSTNPDKYQITFTPSTFFNKPPNEILQIGLKLKTKNWNDNKQTDVDKFINISQGFDVSFVEPTQSSFFKNTNEQFNIEVNASESSTLTLKINGTIVKMQGGTTSLIYVQTVTETAGTTLVVCEAVAGSQSKTISFSYTIRSVTVDQPRPPGAKKGINYFADQTKVVLNLLAPAKSSVYVVGDFTDWNILSAYQMKRDGEYFWLEISGLAPGVEYAFQYLVDEATRISDPFADKIVDTDDQFIPASTYPNLKSFPAKAISDKWYFNRASILQTGQTPYAWQSINYQRPLQNKLVIYELLIRDFFDTGKKSYQSLIDTIGYFKKLGVNAIELMPITEFNGNDSWGYNPTFMFAPDKFYGTKNKLKEFIDKCHQSGIAVIMDIVMNQQDAPNAYLLMDFDFIGFKPNPTNKWFNVTATHPFSVFFDLNHESLYTKAYLDTINHYWLNEYKIDGFRYDLSKGFTQRNNPTNAAAWSAYDDSRIAILKRMYDKIKSHTPDAYIILEHFADNAEEKVLADYGMMPWANFNNAYLQSALGYESNSDISGIFYKNRGWNNANGVGYMESHDEERMMFKNLQFGNSKGDYSIKNLGTALNRVKAAATLFYCVPGPKMLWQFGELGYDVSIEQGGRTTAKPIKWNYYSEPDRKNLFDYTSELIKAKKLYPIFNTSDVTITSGNTLQKQVILKSVPYNSNPSNTDQMNMHAVANFDVAKSALAVNFLHQGKWYDFVTGAEFEISTIPFSIMLDPGAFYLFTDVALKAIVGLPDQILTDTSIYPNPIQNILSFNTGDAAIQSITLVSMQGVKSIPLPLSSNSWDVSNVSPGLYIVEIKTGESIFRTRIVKY